METTDNNNQKKPNAWDIILKIIIAIAGALGGFVSANAMNALS